MSICARLWLAVLLLLTIAAAEVRAQVQALEDRPAPSAPRQPLTRQELDRREALTLYAQALLREHDDRLLEAAKLLEQARSLDPEGAYVSKALVPLYLALCRTDDALAACRKVLDLDPGDYQTWYLYARQLKDKGQAEEALTAYARAVACSGLKDHPDLSVQMHYDQGILYEEAHDYARAEAAFRAVAKVLEHPEALLDAGRFDPEQIKAEAAKTYESIGRVCTQARHYEEAVAAYRQACALDPERSGRLNYNLAKVLVAEDRAGPALEALDGYLRTQPQGVEAYELKITLLKQLGRSAEVLPALKAQADRDAHNVPLHLLLAREYGQAGQVVEAESLYKRLAVENPVPEVYRGLLELYRDRGRMADAVTLLNALQGNGRGGRDRQQPDPDSAAQARAMLAVLREDANLGKAFVISAWAEWRGGRKLGPQTSYFLAVLASRAHLLPEAEQFYRQCLENPFLVHENEFDFYSGLLRVLIQQQKFRDMETICRQGLVKAEATTQLLLHYELARALAWQDRPDEALKEADAAVDLANDANRLGCRQNRVQILNLAGRHDKAAAECQAMFKEFPRAEDQRAIRYLLSGVYSEAHDYARSEEQLRRILKENPNDVAVHNDLGYIMADQGKNLDEAERLIRRAIELDRQEKQAGKSVSADGEGDNYQYLDSLGWVLFRRGQLEEARAWLEKAIAVEDGGHDPVIWDHLGDVHAQQDEAAQARACWQKAVTLYEKEKRRRMDDRYEEVKRKLKLLKPDTHP